MSLFSPSLTHQPSRRIRNEEDEDHDEDSRETLEDQGELPSEVALDVACAESDRSRWNGSAEIAWDPSLVISIGSESWL
jgi:hypothetical protein